jgi:hypothetical protein
MFKTPHVYVSGADGCHVVRDDDLAMQKNIIIKEDFHSGLHQFFQVGAYAPFENDRIRIVG